MLLTQHFLFFPTLFYTPVGRIQDFDGSIPGLGRYSFLGLMIVIATGLISLSALSIVSTMLMWESSQWFGEKKYCADCR